jgi:Tfp pilus assembly protein PilN
MRSVNLIPKEERRGDGAPLRTGNLIYVLTAGLAVLVLGVVAVALTSKQIKDRESQKSSLQQELTEATAKAQTLQAFSDFRAVQESRAATVSSLAQSRFDWPRVLHEFALVIPSNVQINSLTGTVSPDVQMQSSGGVSTRTEVAGPALEIVGCAPGQDAVAAFVSALEDIDGVTRVGVSSSKLPDDTGNSGMTGEPGDAAASSGGSGATGSSDCQTGPEIAKFEILAAFDAVPAPSTATTAPSVPSTAAPASGSAQPAAEVQSQENVTKTSLRQADAKSQQAIHNYNPEPGG